MDLKRGDVLWVPFDPSVGGEAQKTRPGIVLSNDEANRALNRVIVVPLTSSTERVYPGEALVTLDGRESKAMASQLTTVGKLRLGRRIGSLTPVDLRKVEDALLFQLRLEGLRQV